MIVPLLYRAARTLLSIPRVLLRRDTAKDTELLVLRHENTVLRRQLKAAVRYEPADRFWFSALSSLIPRRRWATVFPVTPPDPGRTRSPGTPDRPVHGLGDLDRRWHRPCPTTDRTELARVPDRFRAVQPHGGSTALRIRYGKCRRPAHGKASSKVRNSLENANPARIA